MFLSFILAFLVCGIICALAEIIIVNSKLTPGHVTSLFVVFGTILEFFNIYDKIKKIGGMGAILPICSFGSTIMKGVKEMARQIIEAPAKDKTTIVTSKLLLDRMGVHVKMNGDNQTDFITRAILNQLEREGDVEIRLMMEEDNNGN